MNIKEYILENKQKIALGFLGAAAFAGFCYWLVRKPTKLNEKLTPVPEVMNSSKASVTSTVENNEEEEESIQNEYDQKLTHIIGQIRMIFIKNSDQISPEAITAIVEGQYNLSNQEIRSIVLKCRKQRRQKMDDPLQYAKIFTVYQLQLEQTQQKHLGVILARFNIDKVTWKEATQQWESQTTGEDQGISELIRREEQKQLLSLLKPGFEPLGIKKISKILEGKIRKLKQLNVEQLGIQIAADEAVRYEIIESFINDLIKLEFGVEPQQVEDSIEKMGHEDKLKVIEYQDEIADIMNELIVIEQDQQEEGNQGEFSAQEKVKN